MLTEKDQRKFSRMLVNSEVTLTLLDEASTTDSQPRRLSGVCRDLSATGTSIEVAEALAPDTQFQVDLETDGPAADLHAICQVVRCEPADDGGYVLGCEIVDWGPEAS